MNLKQFEHRKHEHIALSHNHQHQSDNKNGLEQIELIHCALPEINFQDISLAHHRFRKKTTTPFLVSSMTAGHNKSLNINLVLAKACEQRGWAMGVGSQRRQLNDPSAAEEWLAIRECCPSVTLFANLGISQLIQAEMSAVLELISSIQASAIIIHCNPLQECLQPEGTPEFKGGIDAIRRLCRYSPVPVIVKETGCGFSQETLKKLNRLPVAAVDISGNGGTHWGRIEGSRNPQSSLLRRVADTFANWGNSTLSGLLASKKIRTKYEVWGSGGIRNGLEAAKLLALGAHTVGIAQPLLKPALQGTHEVIKEMEKFEYELKLALFCTGCASIDELQRKPVWHFLK